MSGGFKHHQILVSWGSVVNPTTKAWFSLHSALNVELLLLPPQLLSSCGWILNFEGFFFPKSLGILWDVFQEERQTWVEIRIPQTQIPPAGSELPQGAGMRYKIYFVGLKCEISMVFFCGFSMEKMERTLESERGTWNVAFANGEIIKN